MSISESPSQLIPRPNSFIHRSINQLVTHLRQPPPRINRIRNLARPRPILRIPLITITVQLIPTRRHPHTPRPLNRIHPPPPATPRLGLRPPAVRPQHAAQPQHPGPKVHVYEGDVWAEEEGARGVCGVDEGGDLGGQGFGVRDLVRRVLGLEQLVEEGDDVSVYVVGPEARCSARLGVGREERGARGQVLEVLEYDCGFVR